MYWKMKNNEYISTKAMDANHLYHTLMMLVNKAKGDRNLLAFLLDCILKGKEELISDQRFKLNGDIAQMQLDEFDEDNDDCYPDDYFQSIH